MWPNLSFQFIFCHSLSVTGIPKWLFPEHASILTLICLWKQCFLCLNNPFLLSPSGKCLAFFQDSYSRCNFSWYLSSSKRLICLSFCNSTNVCVNICVPIFLTMNWISSLHSFLAFPQAVSAQRSDQLLRCSRLSASSLQLISDSLPSLFSVLFHSLLSLFLPGAKAQELMGHHVVTAIPIKRN